MTTQEPSSTPLTDLFIRRAAGPWEEENPWRTAEGDEIQVTPEDIERYAPAELSPETIEKAKRLAQARRKKPCQETK